MSHRKLANVHLPKDPPDNLCTLSDCCVTYQSLTNDDTVKMSCSGVNSHGPCETATRVDPLLPLRRSAKRCKATTTKLERHAAIIFANIYTVVQLSCDLSFPRPSFSDHAFRGRITNHAVSTLVLPFPTRPHSHLRVLRNISGSSVKSRAVEGGG